MITFTDAKLIPGSDEPLYLKEGRCLSTDQKPTDVANGSILIEMDTGKVLMFDAAGNVWKEFVS